MLVTVDMTIGEEVLNQRWGLRDIREHHLYRRYATEPLAVQDCRPKAVPFQSRATNCHTTRDTSTASNKGDHAMSKGAARH